MNLERIFVLLRNAGKYLCDRHGSKTAMPGDPDAIQLLARHRRAVSVDLFHHYGDDTAISLVSSTVELREIMRSFPEHDFYSPE